MSFRRTVKKLIPRSMLESSLRAGHWCEAVLFNVLYGFPARKLKVIGVTGTNGKTTTSFLIHSMLNQAGYKVGLMTTVGYGLGDDIKLQIDHMTNVPVPQLMKRLKTLNKQGMEWLVLETTSHALAQNRVWGIPYSMAVLTNLTHEHLDFHKTFEAYREAKLKLFKMCNNNLKGFRTGIINADDPSADIFASAINKPVFFGLEKGDIRPTKVRLQPDGVDYDVVVDKQTYHIHCNIPSNFSTYNSLAAVTVGLQLGLTKSQIEQGIASLQAVEGRMSRIDEGQPFSVIVDFAHTPDSFEKLFKDLRPAVKGKLIVLFGSAGRRDEAKRGLQGKLAGQYADEVIVTEEDDRDIDGLVILEQIAKGVRSSGKKDNKDLFLVHDRTEAIDFALRRASSNQDMVLLLGKGHEKTIERADGEHPWNEIEVAHAALKKLR